MVHKRIILLLVVYGCQTWYFALRNERKSEIFGTKMLRRMSVLDLYGQLTIQ